MLEITNSDIKLDTKIYLVIFESNILQNRNENKFNITSRSSSFNLSYESVDVI